MTTWCGLCSSGPAVVEALARRLGCSEGHVWTLGLTLLLTIALVPATFPAGLRPRGDTTAAVALQSPNLVAPAPGAPLGAAPSPALLPPIPLPQPGAPPTPDPAPMAVPEPDVSASPGAPPAPTAAAQPLRAVQTGWYDGDTEATLRKEVTPVGELPVSADRGARAATSVFRLTGNAPTLLLAVDTGPGRTVGKAAVELCRNTTSTWTGYDAMPTSAAPPYDPDCRPGTDQGDAHWSFALAGLGRADADTGFTLRATVSGSPTETFSVTFYQELTS